MMPLETFVTEYLATLSTGYFVKQYITVISLFIFGAVLSDHLSDRKASLLIRCTLAYPLGVCAFSITSYVMLIIGIPFNKWTICGALAIELAVVVFCCRKSYAEHIGSKSLRNMLLCFALVLVVAFIAVSGIAPVIISNDSMYFYRRYPDCIVYYERLRDQFDFWMTDTGLGAVAVDALPALFGFGESFGIREFFHINFIAFFAVNTYEKAGEYFSGKRRIVAAVIISMALVFSTPFVILGHWALANMYYMELFFIAAYYTFGSKGRDFGASAVLLTALALFRIEGTMFVEWMILCLSYYCNMGRKLARSVLLPVFVLFGGYCLKIFTQFYILDDIYLFMTPQKAVMLVGTIAAVMVYIAFIEHRLPHKISGKLPAVYLSAMVLGNILFLLYDKDHYIGNLKAFRDNLFRQSGWGMVSYLTVATAVVFAIEFVFVQKEKKVSIGISNSFNIVLTVGFFLIVLAAAFGRGDVLSENVGDSGNRVLLQITPLIVMMFGELGMKLVNIWDES